MTIRRDHHDLDNDGRRLVDWLHEQHATEPSYGFLISHIAAEMGWSYNKTTNTIHHIRNRMPGPRYQIYCFKSGRAWYYKIPSGSEASDYEEVRGRDVAVRSGNILMQVRKRAALFGVTHETDRRTRAYTEILHWLGEAGVEDAEAILEAALQPLDLNGQVA